MTSQCTFYYCRIRFEIKRLKSYVAFREPHTHTHIPKCLWHLIIVSKSDSLAYIALPPCESRSRNIVASHFTLRHISSREFAHRGEGLQPRASSRAPRVYCGRPSRPLTLSASPIEGTTGLLCSLSDVRGSLNSLGGRSLRDFQKFLAKWQLCAIFHFSLK